VANNRTDCRESCAWYVRYPDDSQAMGPFRYNERVKADRVSDDATKWFGGRPSEVWPDGKVEFVPEYEYEVQGE